MVLSLFANIYQVQCSAAVHHLIVNATLNISSDVMMLCIPLPLLITSKLPRAKYVHAPYAPQYAL